ncbi:MAG: hypothetical protein WB791_05255 [Waddliaceae bacterium]
MTTEFPSTRNYFSGTEFLSNGVAVRKAAHTATQRITEQIKNETLKKQHPQGEPIQLEAASATNSPKIPEATLSLMERKNYPKAGSRDEESTEQIKNGIQLIKEFKYLTKWIDDICQEYFRRCKKGLDFNKKQEKLLEDLAIEAASILDHDLMQSIPKNKRALKGKLLLLRVHERIHNTRMMENQLNIDKVEEYARLIQWIDNLGFFETNPPQTSHKMWNIFYGCMGLCNTWIKNNRGDEKHWIALSEKIKSRHLQKVVLEEKTAELCNAFFGKYKNMDFEPNNEEKLTEYAEQAKNLLNESRKHYFSKDLENKLVLIQVCVLLKNTNLVQKYRDSGEDRNCLDVYVQAKELGSQEVTEPHDDETAGRMYRICRNLLAIVFNMCNKSGMKCGKAGLGDIEVLGEPAKGDLGKDKVTTKAKTSRKKATKKRKTPRTTKPRRAQSKSIKKEPGSNNVDEPRGRPSCDQFRHVGSEMDKTTFRPAPTPAEQQPVPMSDENDAQLPEMR